MKRSKKPPDVGLDVKRFCIIHKPTTSSKDAFTYFSNLPDSQARLQKINDVKDLRLQQPPGSAKRMSDICSNIPSPADITPECGYHRICYQAFTNHISTDRLVAVKPTATGDSLVTERPVRGKCKENHIFAKDCIFCGRAGRIVVKSKGEKLNQYTSVFDLEGGDRVFKAAEKRQDDKLLLRIRGYDLFACGARYHRRCNDDYCRVLYRPNDEENKNTQTALQAAHALAYIPVRTYIIKEVVCGKNNVCKLTFLRDLYRKELSSTDFDNPDYRSENLKVKIQKDESINSLISLVNVCPGNSEFIIVYSNHISKDEAVAKGFMLAHADLVKDCAELCRLSIMNRWEKCEDMPWPPTAADLTTDKVELPHEVFRFLSILIGGSDTKYSQRTERLVFSIRQDLLRAATNGEWKQPKHILLATTLRHLFRSKEMITILNRLGHCDNYTAVLELENALAEALEKASTVVTPSIVRGVCNILFHSVWDNFDQLLASIRGLASIHIATGMMAQEVADIEDPPSPPSLPRLDKTSHHNSTPHQSCEDSVAYDEVDFNPKAVPAVMESATDLEERKSAQLAAEKRLLVFILCRQLSALTEQKLPAISGYTSLTGEAPKNLTKLDYYPVINRPINEPLTLKQILHTNEVATEEVGQSYVITTVDEGVYQRLMPIIWSKPAIYKNHIVLMGGFHITKNYLSRLGRKVADSGYKDILIEAHLTTSGTLNGILACSGNLFNKAFYIHKVILEALERLLYLQFGDPAVDDSAEDDTLYNLIFSPSKESLELVLSDPLLQKKMDSYLKFQQDVRNGKLGLTAKFWMSVIDDIRLAVYFDTAVKTNDFELYKWCLHEMSCIFFSHNGQNYSRYLPILAITISNIELTHPGATKLLKAGAISAAKSQVPGSRIHGDLLVETEINKHGKSRGMGGGSGAGFSGLLTKGKEGSLQKYVKTTHQRAGQFKELLRMADMESSAGCEHEHRSTRKSEIAKQEKDVLEVMDVFQNHFMNPFDIDDKEGLYIVSSGLKVPSDIADDILSTDDWGRSARDTYISERLLGKADKELDRNIHKPIARCRKKGFDSIHKKIKLTASNQKVVCYQEQTTALMKILIKSQQLTDAISLEHIFSHPLTVVPTCFGTPDGVFAKTNKAKAFKHITKDVSDVSFRSEENNLTIQDGNAIFHQLKEIPETFEKIAQKIYKQGVGNKTNVIFSTDSYDPQSLKSHERSRRGSSDTLLVKGVNTRSPKDFKSFLKCDTNKEQLCQILEKVWSGDTMVKMLSGKKVTLVVKGKAVLLTSDGESTTSTEIPSLFSTHDETDRRVVIYVSHAQEEGYEIVTVRTPDSDIFFILLHHAFRWKKLKQLILDIGTGVNRRRIDILSLASKLGKSMCTALLGLHCYTGDDCNSAFRGKGKIPALKLLDKRPEYVEAFEKLGDDWTIPTALEEIVEKFTCELYGCPRYNKLNSARLFKVKSMCGSRGKITSKSKIELYKLPPCYNSFKPHFLRSNFQIRRLKLSNIPCPNIPNPEDGHGWIREDDRLEPQWTDGPILPENLVDLLSDSRQPDGDSDVDGDLSDSEPSEDSDSESGADSDFSDSDL